MSNLAEALVEQYRLSEALVLFRAALTLRPTDATTGFAYGVALLLSGSLAEGWHHFEARRAMAAWHYDRRRDLPQWVEGMPCAGLRVRATRLRRRHRGSPFRFGLLAAAGATAGRAGLPVVPNHAPPQSPIDPPPAPPLSPPPFTNRGRGNSWRCAR